MSRMPKNKNSILYQQRSNGESNKIRVRNDSSKSRSYSFDREGESDERQNFLTGSGNETEKTVEAVAGHKSTCLKAYIPMDGVSYSKFLEII